MRFSVATRLDYLLPMLYKVIYREIAMTWKYAENLIQERRMSYLEDILWKVELKMKQNVEHSS
jgi:hypothetical protein